MCLPSTETSASQALRNCEVRIRLVPSGASEMSRAGPRSAALPAGTWVNTTGISRAARSICRAGAGGGDWASASVLSTRASATASAARTLARFRCDRKASVWGDDPRRDRPLRHANNLFMEVQPVMDASTARERLRHWHHFIPPTRFRAVVTGETGTSVSRAHSRCCRHSGWGCGS